MKTLDLYLARQIAKPIAIALGISLAVLLIERLLRMLDVILGAQGPLGLVVQILTYLTPQYVGLALPISLLLGVMIAFNALGRNGEVDALQSAGIGLLRQARAAIVIGLAVAAVTGVTLGYLKPFGRYTYQSAVFAVTQAAFHALLRAGVFTEFGNTTFLIDEIGSNGGFSGVFVYESTGKGGSSAITAGKGMLARGAATGAPILRLFDGERLAVGASDGADPGARRTVGVLRFTELRRVLTDSGGPMFRPRGVDEREYTLSELWTARDTPPPGVRRSDMVAEFHGRLVRTVTAVFLPFLAIALALGRSRSDRTWGVALGVVLLVAFNQVLNFGENVAETGKVGPFEALWLPLIVFGCASLGAFWRVARVPPSGTGLVGFGAIPLLGRLSRRRSASEPREATQ